MQVALLSQRGRAMLCVYQLASIRRAQLIVISASDLPLRTNKFCSLLFSSSWSSMLVVINKDSLMRRHMCGKLHGGPSQLLFALLQSSIDSQLFVENRDFCLPHLHSTTPSGGPSRNIVMTFGIEKLAWFGYPSMKIVWGYDYSFWQNSRTWQTDRRTDTARRHRPR